MQNLAADLTQILGVERVLWEQEHLVTYGFDAYNECRPAAARTSRITDTCSMTIRFMQDEPRSGHRSYATSMNGWSKSASGCPW